MKYEEYIDKLGGVKLFDPDEEKIIDSYISENQDVVGFTLPEDYKQFLLT